MKLLRYLIPLLFWSASAHALSIQQTGYGATPIDNAISGTTITPSNITVSNQAIISGTTTFKNNVGIYSAAAATFGNLRIQDTGSAPLVSLANSGGTKIASFECNNNASGLCSFGTPSGQNFALYGAGVQSLNLLGDGSIQIPSGVPITSLSSITVTTDRFTVGITTLAVAGGQIGIYTAPSVTSGFAIDISTNMRWKGDTSGATISNAYVGAISSGTGPSSQGWQPSATYMSIATMTLTAGVWLITGSCDTTVGGTTAATAVRCGISTSNTSLDASQYQTEASATLTAGQPEYLTVAPRIVNITAANTPYYLMSFVIYTVANTAAWQVDSYIQAVRIR